MSDDLLTSYLQSHADKWKPRTLSDSRKHLNYYFKFAGSNQLSPTTEAAINAFQQYMQNKKISIVTKYGYLRHLRLFLKHAAPNLAGLVKIPSYQQNRTKTFRDKKKTLIKSLVNSYPRTSVTIRDSTICALYYIDKISARNIEALTTLDIDLLSAELRIISRQRFHCLHHGSFKLMQAYLKVRSDFKPASNQLFVKDTGTPVTYDNIMTLIHAQVQV